MKYLFTLSASHYFEHCPDMLSKIKSGEIVEVLLDQDQQTALFSWKSANGQPCAFPEWMPENYTLALNQVLSFFGKAAQ